MFSRMTCFEQGGTWWILLEHGQPGVPFISVVCIECSLLTGPGRFEWVCSGLSILLLPRLPEVGDWVSAGR